MLWVDEPRRSLAVVEYDDPVQEPAEAAAQLTDPVSATELFQLTTAATSRTSVTRAPVIVLP